MRSRALACACLLALLVLGPGGARADEPPLEVAVLTFNIHGLPYIDPTIDVRVAAIGRAIRALAPDVVALQEVWRKRDAEALARAGREAGLEHSHVFEAPAAGSGLVILSRFPIAETRFRAFSKNGDLWRAVEGHMDRFATKGVGAAVLQTPAGRIALLDTHCVAPHRRSGKDLVRPHRLVQMGEIASLLDEVAADAPAILCGDLNARPGSPEIALLAGRARVKDTVSVAERRIDYVLYRDSADRRFQVISAGDTLTEPVAGAEGGERFLLSDHPAVLARLRLERAPPASSAGPQSGDARPPR